MNLLHRRTEEMHPCDIAEIRYNAENLKRLTANARELHEGRCCHDRFLYGDVAKPGLLKRVNRLRS